MNTVQKQFSDALKREGKTITTYYKNETVQCLFRKNKDYNNIDSHLTIFYDVNSPIKQGQLLTYSGYHYIVLNKETVENNVYNKSALLQCNLLLPVIVNQVNQNIPCYAGELQSPTVIEGNIITTLDGRVEIMAESTDMINNIAFNTTYSILGGYYEVNNKYNRSGISYTYVERTEEPPKEYKLELTSSASQYKVGKTTQLTATPTINGVIDETAYITYTTSDEMIATVDNNGLVTFIAKGTVTITSTWVEQSITDTITFTVVADVPETPNYTMTITYDKDLIIGALSPTIFTPHLKDSSGVEQTFTAVWTINYNGMDSELFTVTYNGNLCKVQVDEDYGIIDQVLILTCKTEDKLYSATINMTITTGW